MFAFSDRLRRNVNLSFSAVVVRCQKYVLCDILDVSMGKYVSSMGPGIYLKGWNYLKKYKHIHISSVINPTDFGYFQQFEKNLESNWHWLKMVKNGHFLVKNEFQRPRLGGVFLIAKSVSLLSSCTDFDLWKSFQSRLLRPNGRLRRNNYTKIIPKNIEPFLSVEL